MLRNSLLTFHLVGVVVWLGCGLFDVFLSREITRSRDTPLELHLLRIQNRYGWAVAAATFLVAATGVGMASFVGWGYFGVFWLGAKQAIMLAIVLGMLAMIPMVIEIERELRGLASDARVTPRLRLVSRRAELCYDLMRVGGLVALVLAVWRPS